MQTEKKIAITVDLKKDTLITLPQFIQNDTNTIEFTVQENGAAVDYTNISRIVANYKRPDGKVVSRLLDVVTGVIPYTIGAAEMEVAGLGELEVQFSDSTSGERISTKKMKVKLIAEVGEADQITT